MASTWRRLWVGAGPEWVMKSEEQEASMCGGTKTLKLTLKMVT